MIAMVGVPTLVVAALAWSAGRWQGPVVGLGALAYLLYNDFAFLFATPFNRLFLLWVTTLSVSLLTMAFTVRSIDPRAVAAHLERVPGRGIAGYMWTVVALNALVWLRVVVPAMFAERPGSFLDGRDDHNPFYVQASLLVFRARRSSRTGSWQRAPGVSCWRARGCLRAARGDRCGDRPVVRDDGRSRWPAIASIEGMACSSSSRRSRWSR